MTPNNKDLEQACESVNVFLGEFYRKISLMLLGISELIMVIWIWIAITVYCFMNKWLAIGPALMALYQIKQYMRHDKSYRKIPAEEENE